MADSPQKPETEFARRWLAVVWAVVTMLACGLEVRRLCQALNADAGLSAWLFYWDMESTLPCLVLLSLPVVILAARLGRKRRPAFVAAGSTESPGRSGKTAAIAVLLFVVSMFCSWQVGSRTVSASFGFVSIERPFSELPPAYHDEYSYLLQARTFLNGRLSWPGMSIRPDLFHQFHVLNERRTVSRYFPWTGAWIAPFEALGTPVVGHWIAGGLATSIFFLALVQIVSVSRAFAGGMLIAVSPGLAVFSNLLLAHHPTMLALSIFLAAFIRMARTQQTGWALLSGAGLTLAMLGRPMTAAGFAMPFGIWLLAGIVRKQQSVCLGGGFAVPLLAGFCMLGIMNHDATGSWTRTAYQEYTEAFTPRHQYGFNNASVDSDGKGPPAVKAYDRWAGNLTADRAVQNVWTRVLASLQWSLAMLPILFCVLMSLPTLADPDAASGGNPDRRNSLTDQPHRTKAAMLRLTACSIITLHAVHVPYWFDGIMHWHYVFETAPLILLLAGIGCVNAATTLAERLNPHIAAIWVLLVPVSGLLPGWFALPVFDNVSKTGAAVSELSYSRTRFEFFNRIVSGPKISKPALILVDENGSDPQLSYIINEPELDTDTIVCRLPVTEVEFNELSQAFSDRKVYVFDPAMLTFTKYSRQVFREPE